LSRSLHFYNTCYKQLITKARFHTHEERYRINSSLFASANRVLDKEGKQVGVISKDEALKLAQEQELDLVEVAPAAKPPVAKLIDFNKFLYQQAKKKQEEKKKAKTSETKEIRLGPFMSDNDLQVMIRRGREFLEDGDKIRLVVRFRGRQITHPEFGRSIVGNCIDGLSDISKVEREAHFEGNQLLALLVAERNKKHAKTEDQEISSKTI